MCAIRCQQNSVSWGVDGFGWIIRTNEFSAAPAQCIDRLQAAIGDACEVLLKYSRPLTSKNSQHAKRARDELIAALAELQHRRIPLRSSANEPDVIASACGVGELLVTVLPEPVFN